MESNKQTELTSKTDVVIDGEQMTANGGGRLAGGGMEPKGKGPTDTDNSVVIAEGRWVEED